MKIKARRYYIYYATRILFFITRLVPRSVSQFLAGLCGKVAFSLAVKYKEKAISNLDDVLGGEHKKNVRIAERVFRNLAKSGADWIKFGSYSKKDIEALVTEVHGLENLDRALSGGNGVILLASHFGNWELLSIYLYTRGYTGAIVAKRIYFHKYDKFIVGLRERFGANVVYRDESPKKLLKVLRNGEMLGILADQNVDSVDGVNVDFFGKPAFTPTAPVKFALAAGVSMVPAFMIRKPDDSYKLVVEEPIIPSKSEDRAQDIIKYTQAWTDVLEKYVRQYPDQWVWLHDRWKVKI